MKRRKISNAMIAESAQKASLSRSPLARYRYRGRVAGRAPRRGPGCAAPARLGELWCRCGRFQKGRLARRAQQARRPREGTPRMTQNELRNARSRLRVLAA